MDNHSDGRSSPLRTLPASSSRRSHLSLTKKGLTKLLPSLPKEPKCISSLDCSRNSFKHIDCLRRLENCDEINASYNRLVNFASFTPIHRSLKILDVSHNEITDTANLCSLERLEFLDASYNAIGGLPVMSGMTNLVSINLASNNVSSLLSLRGMSKLQKLRVLDLSDNKISSLHNADKQLPLKLKRLDLSGNAVADLTEAYQLCCLKELEEIVWHDNPCVLKDRKFDYRSFLLCCCSQDLKSVDNVELSECEILKGELLLTKGKWRRYQTSGSLCDYLTEECPLESCDCVSGSITDFERQVKKVIAKRREYLSLNNQKTEGLGSRGCESLPPSPFTQWTEQDPNRTSVSEIISSSHDSVQKENRPPEQFGGSSDESMVSSTTVVLSTSHDVSSSLIPEIRNDACVRRSASTSFIENTPETSATNKNRSSKMSKKRISARAVRGGNAPSFGFLRTRRRDGSFQGPTVEERLLACENRCKELENAVLELSKHNQQLSETNEQLTHIIERVNEKIVEYDAVTFGGWKKLIHFAVPVPVDLKYERQSPTEVLLKWNHCSVIQPTSHGFTVNEDFIGKSRAAGNQTLIGDLLPDKEATIKVHCYVDDIEGERSLPVYIPPYCGDAGCKIDGETKGEKC